MFSRWIRSWDLNRGVCAPIHILTNSEVHETPCKFMVFRASFCEPQTSHIDCTNRITPRVGLPRRMASIAFVRCYLANGDRFHDITHGMCADWFLSLSPAGSPAPVSGVWADVPQDALHGPIVRCSFNVMGYIEWTEHEDSESEDANEDSEEEDNKVEDDNEDEEDSEDERSKRRRVDRERSDFVAAAALMASRGNVDLERARMALEDMCSRAYIHS